MGEIKSAGDQRAAERFAPSPANQRRLRDAFGRFATGVTVVTAPSPDGPVGITANSFSSVSLDPPLVLWCLGKSCDRFDAFADAPRYAIHVLHAEHRALSEGFARDRDHFGEVAWQEGHDGVPALETSLARFDCVRHAVHDAGDHVIVVGRVLSVDLADGDPLLFALGSYGEFSRH